LSNELVMNRHLPRSVLKVDSTCDFLRGEKKEVLIIYNINIPIYIVNHREELQNVLERIKNLLYNEFYENTVTFQITASYLLKHTETGQIRAWTGSFFVKNNTLAKLSPFLLFEKDSFIRKSLIEIQDINNKLKLQNVDTKWRFERLESIIFNVQCKVNTNHHIIKYRQLCNGLKRSHKVFSIP